MWSLLDKGLCPGWRVQSAAVSGDQPLWKVFKRLFHPCVGSVSDESGMRNRIPHIPGSWISWEKAYVQYGTLWKASAAFFSSLCSATRPVLVWWELEESGVGEEWCGHQGACWHSQTVLKHAGSRGYSNTAVLFVVKIYFIPPLMRHNLLIYTSKLESS